MDINKLENQKLILQLKATPDIERWKLILGNSTTDNQDGGKGWSSQKAKKLDAVLEALYDSNRQGGLGSSSPNINRWLGDIRKYFPSSVVQIMQRDALHRLGLSQMLLQPELLEQIEPDVHLVGTLLSLNKAMPDQTRSTAKEVVRKVVQDLQKKLYNPLREAVEGTLSRSIINRHPKYRDIDWHKTIRLNLKHYQPDYQTIIPELLRGYGKKNTQLKHIILLIDQSGSMASSLVYASVFGAVLASIRAVKTSMIVFDTQVADLTESLEDPVDLLFGTQLGGGTDINKALTYIKKIITTPRDTILVLISDLYEGGNTQEMLTQAYHLKNAGIQFVTLLALDDEGSPAYDSEVAAAFAGMNIPSFACSPDKFPDLMAAAIKQENLMKWNR